MTATAHRREGARPTVSTSEPQRLLDQSSSPAIWGELVELGWAEPHQYVDWGTEFLVYGPRDRHELAVNPPGVSGDMIPWKDQSHGTSQHIPARAS